MVGLEDGVRKDVWVPLEKINTGEIRLIIETTYRETDVENLQACFSLFPYLLKKKERFLCFNLYCLTLRTYGLVSQDQDWLTYTVGTSFVCTE